MKLFRVTNEAYAANFSGRGASFTDGARWNLAGTPVIYFGLDMATALVESANYHPSPRLMPPSHCKAIYELPNDVSQQTLSLSKLPKDWDSFPYPASTQKIGDAFLKAGKSLLLLLPSTALGVSADFTMAVFNPLHSEATKIKLLKTERPVYPSRMFSGLK